MKKSIKVSILFLIVWFDLYWLFVALPNALSDKSNLFIGWLVLTPIVSFLSAKFIKKLIKTKGE